MNPRRLRTARRILSTLSPDALHLLYSLSEGSLHEVLRDCLGRVYPSPTCADTSSRPARNSAAISSSSRLTTPRISGEGSRNI